MGELLGHYQQVGDHEHDDREDADPVSGQIKVLTARCGRRSESGRCNPRDQHSKSGQRTRYERFSLQKTRFIIRIMTTRKSTVMMLPARMKSGTR